MVQTADKPLPTETEPRLEKFKRFESAPGQPSWLLALRKSGLSRFAEVGLPTLRDEDWRFTNVSPIAKLPFRPVFQAEVGSLSAGDVARFPYATLAACRQVFVNGHYAPELSTPLPEADGVTVTNIAAALGTSGSVRANAAAHLQEQLAASPGNAFSALNTAFFQDGAFIHVAAGKALATPIHLLFVSTSKETGASYHPRNVIVAERSSQATVLETYVSTVEAGYFTNAVTQLVLGEGAVVEHCKFQDESAAAFHIAAIQASLAAKANLVAHSIATGAKLSRNNIHTLLGGEGVECVLNGLYVLHGEQLADHHMVVEHAQPYCTSHEYYNGILDGRSRGVFHGRILVRQAAQKTDAKQTNKNLLLSEEATVDTKPQLEIYADDVKCTHGATVGQLNDESIFYLRARGIGAATARRMLIHAFAGEIVERIRSASVREELNQLIWDRLEANPHLALPGTA